MTQTSASPRNRRPAGPGLGAILPVAGAIAVFGVIFGAAAQPLLGPALTLLSSVVVFSGAAQFSMVALLAGGASGWSVLGAVAVLSLRHLVLGAAVRPGLTATPTRRAGLAWFLIDETVGLALAGGGDTGRVLLRAGVVCYGGWILGTAIGMAGGAAMGLEALASAVFPVLFVGLAAIIASGAALALRAVVAAGLTAVLLLVWPGVGGLAPVIGAVAACVPGRREPASEDPGAQPEAATGAAAREPASEAAPADEPAPGEARRRPAADGPLP